MRSRIFRSKTLELAKLDEAKEGAFIQVVEPAVAPERKSFPKRLWITLGALAVGLTVGILAVLFEAGLARMRKDPAKREKLDEIRQVVGRRAVFMQANSTSTDVEGKGEKSPRPARV